MEEKQLETRYKLVWLDVTEIFINLTSHSWQSSPAFLWVWLQVCTHACVRLALEETEDGDPLVTHTSTRGEDQSLEMMDLGGSLFLSYSDIWGNKGFPRLAKCHGNTLH